MEARDDRDVRCVAMPFESLPSVARRGCNGAGGGGGGEEYNFNGSYDSRDALRGRPRGLFGLSARGEGVGIK